MSDETQTEIRTETVIQKVPDNYYHGAWILLAFVFAYGLGSFMRGKP